MSRAGALQNNENVYTITPNQRNRIVMEETKIDRETMAKLARALAFICGPADPVTVALKAAAESGSPRDAKKARALFLKLKPGHRQAALSMLSG